MFSDNPITEKNPKILPCAERNAFANECILMLLDTFQDLYGADALALYVNEHEHALGVRYWKSFNTVEDAREDFKLYIANLMA